MGLLWEYRNGCHTTTVLAGCNWLFCCIRFPCYHFLSHWTKYYRSGGSSDEISNKNNRIIPRGGEFMKLLEMGGGDKNDRIIDT
mmetsp:Transcript_46441/g.54268  ORF Transcript_46441/g.54268 Transcript_46441/m.54268 type:complete len:84 (+) Transcript_46441:154-405(+)